MKTQYINKYINEYKQIDICGLFKRINFLVRDSKFDINQLYKADKMINELYEISTGTIYENVNSDLFVLTFDELIQMDLLIEKISNLMINAGVIK